MLGSCLDIFAYSKRVVVNGKDKDNSSLDFNYRSTLLGYIEVWWLAFIYYLETQKAIVNWDKDMG